jgi:5'-nucleotidase
VARSRPSPSGVEAARRAGDVSGAREAARRPRILLTNDDGIHAEGLLAAADVFAEFADVVVVAPDREQSACGHSLSLNRPLRLIETAAGRFAVDGTPTDCVNLAVHWVLRDQPVDLVVSGINHGLNLGDDVTYSGTVSAALEAHLLRLPAIAFSQQLAQETSFARAARLAGALVRGLLDRGVAERMLLNVNLPAVPASGVRLTRLARRVYEQVVVERGDPRGRRYFWIGGEPRWEEGPDCDHAAVTAGMVSVTPLRLDLTDYDGLAERDDFAAALGRILEETG